MENNQNNGPLSIGSRQAKYTQLNAVSGVLREFVCWYCRELRLSGRLHFIKKRKCSITGQWVNEYTTNEKLVPEFPKQLQLFE